MSGGHDSEAWRHWTHAGQQQALEKLRAVAGRVRPAFYCTDPGRDCDGRPHGEYAWPHARADQWPPGDSEWVTWLMMSGRGAGKTRAGAELTQQMSGVVGRIALVAATGADVRDVLLEGESGLINIAPPAQRPHYEPSKRRVTWPNGCVGTTFSAEEPDRLRGPEHGYAWVDEAAHYDLVTDVWDNLLFGLRIGTRPRVCVTTTPKPRPWLKTLVADSRTRVTRASTYDNLDNLAPTFAEAVIARYEGTRLGRQELYGEILEDVEGALWSWAMIEPYRQAAPPALDRVVVGVDPAGGAKRRNDETGIITAGRAGEHYYVLSDRSGRMSPHGWAMATDGAFEDHAADAVVAETNYGGEMVTANLKASGVPKRVKAVHSRRGKAIRAEPIVALYEQGRVHHIGLHAALEEELTSWQPYVDHDSPNRLDALVHALTELAGRERIIAQAVSPVALDRVRRHLATPARRR